MRGDKPLVMVDLLSYTGTKGGMETYARELYRQFGAMETGYEFVGLASREGYELDLDEWFPGEVVNSGITGEQRFLWAIGELFQVSRWANRLGADLIHAPATLGPMRTKVPTVVSMHDMLYWSHPELMSTPLYTQPVKLMEKLASRNAERILTISQVSFDEIVKYLRFDPERLHIVPLAGTLPPSRSTTRDPERVRNVVLATGNRRPHKNWDSLIRALPLVPEEVRPTVVITGSRGDDPLKAVVDETGMHQWVELKGWLEREELEELYATAAVMAMPSFCDGFCLPALEAMMIGLPVMLSDLPVYREVADDVALYFDPRDLGTIADAMVTVATDKARMAQLSRDGYAQASKFSWERVARESLEVFDLAIGGVRGSTARDRSPV